MVAVGLFFFFLAFRLPRISLIGYQRPSSGGFYVSYLLQIPISSRPSVTLTSRHTSTRLLVHAAAKLCKCLVCGSSFGQRDTSCHPQQGETLHDPVCNLPSRATCSDTSPISRVRQLRLFDSETKTADGMPCLRWGKKKTSALCCMSRAHAVALRPRHFCATVSRFPGRGGGGFCDRGCAKSVYGV